MSTEFCITTKRTVIKRLSEGCEDDLKQIWESIAQTVYAQYDRPHATAKNEVSNTVKRWANCRNSLEHMFFAVYLGEKMIGFYAFHKKNAAFEVGYGFNTAYHGMGYAKESLNAVMNYLKATYAAKFIAGTALENTPSVKLLESCGFKLSKTEKVSFYKDIHGNDIFFDGGVFESE